MTADSQDRSAEHGTGHDPDTFGTPAPGGGVERASEVDDNELVARAKAGDDQALDRLISRHAGAVLRVALSILRDGDRAADAAQETFLKALRALDGFREEASFRTWIMAIAANEARGELRRKGRRNESRLDSVPPPAAETIQEPERIVREEEAGQLRAALEQLPEKQRMAVSLRTYEGLSFREVGEIIGSSEGAARVNYHHGVRRLRDILTGE